MFVAPKRKSRKARYPVAGKNRCRTKQGGLAGVVAFIIENKARPTIRPEKSTALRLEKTGGAGLKRGRKVAGWAREEVRLARGHRVPRTDQVG